MSKLGIIVASTRPGRVGLPVAQWLEGDARSQRGLRGDRVIDLAEVALPFMNSPTTLGWLATPTSTPATGAPSSRGVDAFAVVMPEYNFGFNAELKNAIDYLHNEWKYKPIGFVSYGGVSAGTRAVQMLKQVVTTAEDDAGVRIGGDPLRAPVPR